MILCRENGHVACGGFICWELDGESIEREEALRDVKYAKRESIYEANRGPIHVEEYSGDEMAKGVTEEHSENKKAHGFNFNYFYKHVLVYLYQRWWSWRDARDSWENHKFHKGNFFLMENNQELVEIEDTQSQGIVTRKGNSTVDYGDTIRESHEEVQDEIFKFVRGNSDVYLIRSNLFW